MLVKFFKKTKNLVGINSLGWVWIILRNRETQCMGQTGT